MPAPGAAPPKSCESTRNPHVVEGCLKTAITNPTMTLLGHRRFSAATRHHLLARADHAGAGVCGRAPAGASPGVFPQTPSYCPWSVPHSPTRWWCALAAQAPCREGRGVYPAWCALAGATRCVQRCLVGCLGALPVGVAPSRWGVRSTGRAASPQAAVALAGGVRRGAAVWGAGCTCHVWGGLRQGWGVVFRG